MNIRELKKVLWETVEKFRNNHLEPNAYKHMVLGLVFLKYITQALNRLHEKLEKGESSLIAANTGRLAYAEPHAISLPQKAQWAFLQSNAKHLHIGVLIDDAIDAIEKLNRNLTGIFPKNYADPGVDKKGLGELVELLGSIDSNKQSNGQKELPGEIYEYLLQRFAASEGANADQFYTPRNVLKLLVEMAAPRSGKIYDGCCGAGGVFVESEKFIKKYRGKIDNLSLYGQESNAIILKIAKMNLAIHGLDFNLQSGNIFTNDCHPGLAADFILSHPPFNSGSKESYLPGDKRWKYGMPREKNADYAWLQHFIQKLSPTGTAGIILKNSSTSSTAGEEGKIRKNLVEDKLIDCIVAMPPKLFYNTDASASIWFLTRNKTNNRYTNASEILFIDAQKLGVLVDGRKRELTDENIILIARMYHRWKNINGDYTDIKGFCKAVSIEKVRKNGYTLTPGKYVRGRSVKAVLPAMVLIILFAFLYFAGLKNGLFTPKPKMHDTAITIQPQILKDSTRPGKKLSKTQQKETNKQQAEVKDSPVVTNNRQVEAKNPREENEDIDDVNVEDVGYLPSVAKDNADPVTNKPVEIKPPVEKASEPEEKNGDESTKYKVNSTAYFYDQPDESTRRRAYITHWNNSYANIQALDEKNDFIYVVFTNHLNQTSKGWLRKKDLREIKQ